MSLREEFAAIERARLFARRDLRNCAPCRQKMLASIRGGLSHRMDGRLNLNAILFIGLHAAPGTSTTGISLAEKLQILKKRYDACKTEGLEICIIGTGNRAGIEEVRKAFPGIPLWLVEGEFDRQRGECAIGLRALEHAEQRKA